MQTMYMEIIRGYPYKTPDGVADEIHKCRATVMNRLKDLKKEIESGRYSDYAIIEDEGITLINVPVFFDFLKYRKMLADRNARKYVPPFRPEEIMQISGWKTKVVREEDKQCVN